MKNILQKKAMLSILLLLLTFPAMAQFGDLDEEEDEENAPLEPLAPIDDYIVPLLLAGVATGYYLLSKKKSVA